MDPSLPSILILTRNEEGNIADCLRAASFSDDIVVLDSCSTDRTMEIARSFPHVRVFNRPFDTEHRQRNHALQAIEYKHPWVYVCDADERITPELAMEIGRIVNDPEVPHVAYRLRFKNMFMGRWIRRSSGYPVWIMRLLRPDKVSYEVRETNIHPVVEGTVGELKEHFIHYSFNTGLKRWFEKHNYYSSREALEAKKVRRGKVPWRRLLSGKDPMLRRRTMKNLSFFLSARAGWRFGLMYVLRGGWLEGRAGFHYCMMVATYEYWLELKIRELESDWTGRTDRLAEELMG
jgi:glycosyltransferase involved in cell wall biosynthesis